MYAFKRKNLKYSWIDVFLRFQWQIKKHYLQLLKDPELISAR